jgi:hypothetical protein
VTLDERIDRFVRDFLERGWDCEPWKEAALLANEPGAIRQLLLAFLATGKGAQTFLSDLLPVMPEEEWPSLIDAAVHAARDNELAQDLIHRAALQSPDSLTRHLPKLFATDELFQAYAGVWCFRAADDVMIKRLERALHSANTAAHPDADFRAEYIDTRMRAFSCLLETRRVEAALAAAPALGLDADAVARWLRNANLDDELQPLCNETPLHLAFPDCYLPPVPDHYLRELNPTWPRPAEGATLLRFGGPSKLACPLCGGTAHHLITLDEAELVTCLTCLGWNSPLMWTQHAADGSAQSIEGVGEGRTDFVVTPLRETAVSLVNLGPRWQKQDWGWSNNRENLHRVGGQPCFVQNADYPTCSGCGKMTHFLMQLDSGLPLTDGGDLSWGSGGIGYVFWCTTCRRSAYLWQCT